MVRYLPLDFSWIMRRWVKSFCPDLIVFVEGDIWPNLLKEARRHRALTALVSGKISEKSTKRFRFFRKVAHKIFGSLDLLSVQNEEHRDRFASFIDRPILISGNLKLDIQPHPIDADAIRLRFGLALTQKVLTISSTHAPEEKELLSALRPLWERVPDLVCFLAPRHPERFQEIAALLRDSDSLAYAESVARDHVETAKSALADLPPSPARTRLLALSDFVLARRQ